jgi:hypothetical protein
VRRAQAMWSASPAASSQVAIALTLKHFSLRLNAVASGGTRRGAVHLLEQVIPSEDLARAEPQRSPRGSLS